MKMTNEYRSAVAQPVPCPVCAQPTTAINVGRPEAPYLLDVCECGGAQQVARGRSAARWNSSSVTTTTTSSLRVGT
jgi:hypothetical protein